MPRTLSAPLTAGSPRHTMAHAMAPTGPIISQDRFTPRTLRNLLTLVIMVISLPAGPCLIAQVELPDGSHKSCRSMKLKDEFRVGRLRSNLIRNGTAALLLESNEVHKRMGDLIRILKRK